MVTTTIYSCKELGKGFHFEIEYIHDDDTYQIIISEYINNSRNIIKSIQLINVQVAGLLKFLEITRDISNHEWLSTD